MSLKPAPLLQHNNTHRPFAHMIQLACTRFNNSTWEENRRYRQTVGVATMYGSDTRLSAQVAPGEWLAVFEMNNTTNRIMGIGLISNTPLYTPHAIYSIFTSYNLHIYRGAHWFSREDIEAFDATILQDAEQVLFKGRSHMKRLSGITIIGERPFVNWPDITRRELWLKVWALVCTRCRATSSARITAANEICGTS